MAATVHRRPVGTSSPRGMKGRHGFGAVDGVSVPKGMIGDPSSSPSREE
jgi:hypothetical protein